MSKVSLVDYAGQNDVEKIKQLLVTGSNINEFDYDKGALHAACMTNSIEVARILIDNDIDVNMPDNMTGATPLHYRSVYNNFEIANMIIENKGRLDISDNYNNQPLWTSVFNVKGREERLPIVELYLMNGANKNHINKAGRSPLDFASQVKFYPLLELLCKYGDK